MPFRMVLVGASTCEARPLARSTSLFVFTPSWMTVQRLLHHPAALDHLFHAGIRHLGFFAFGGLITASALGRVTPRPDDLGLTPRRSIWLPWATSVSKAFFVGDLHSTCPGPFGRWPPRYPASVIWLFTIMSMPLSIQGLVLGQGQRAQGPYKQPCNHEHHHNFSTKRSKLHSSNLHFLFWPLNSGLFG